MAREVTGQVLQEWTQLWLDSVLAQMQGGFREVSNELCTLVQKASRMEDRCVQLLESSREQVRQMEMIVKTQLGQMQASRYDDDEAVKEAKAEHRSGSDGGAKRKPRSEKGKDKRKGITMGLELNFQCKREGEVERVRRRR